MDGFTYNNIFETKGIEYLVIITFFAILIPFWLLLNRKAKKPAFSRVTGLLTPGSVHIPQGLYFSKFHSWAHLDTNGEAKVGIDDLLLHITGDVNIEYSKKPGEYIKKGELLTKIGHAGKELKIFSPISGEIVAANSMITENAETVKNDPDRQLWIYSVKPANWKAETNSYYLAEEATIWMLRELARFKDFLAASVAQYIPEPSGIVLQDGGELLDQPLTGLPDEIWKDFQDEFLSVKS